MKVNVISCFDGMACGMQALKEAGIKVDKYYAFEIDKYAIQIAQKNHPEIVELGDINNWGFFDLIEVPDIIIAGSPCQGFSIAGQRLNFDDPRSKLFFVFVELVNYWKKRNPNVKILLENVKMKKEWRDIITEHMEIEPVLMNSALVSAQNRERYYWANWTFPQPEDKGILLKDIVLDDVIPVALHNLYGGFKEKTPRVFLDKSPTIRTSAGGGHIPSFVKANLIHSEKAIAYMNRQVADGRNHWDFMHHSDIRNSKSSTVVANFFKGVPYNVFKDWDCIRKFHPIECELLQTMPINYSEGVSNTQRYKMIGNGWTKDMIKHMLLYMPR